HAEDGAVDADAEGQRQHCEGSKTGAAPQVADGVARVLQQRIEQTGPPLIEDILANQGAVAEFAMGGGTRGFGAHAAVAIELGLMFEVRADLVVEVVSMPGEPVHAPSTRTST